MPLPLSSAGGSVVAGVAGDDVCRAEPTGGERSTAVETRAEADKEVNRG